MLNSSKELEVGQFVKSRAGRDKDKVFIVLSIIDEHFVYLVDGDLRKLENPKKKKVKHLKKLSYKSLVVHSAKAAYDSSNNAHIRKEVEKIGLSSLQGGTF